MMTPFWMSWMMFWIVPCPVTKWDEAKKKEMLLLMPVIGLFIGALWYGLSVLAGIFLPECVLVRVLLGVFPWIMTGFIHLDGYLDCSDAVLSFRDREERLRILKDSHVGSFAVVMMALLTAVTCAAAAGPDLTGGLPALLFLPAVTRASSIHCVLTLQPLPSSSYASMHEAGIDRKYRVFSGFEILLLLAVSVPFCGWDSAAVLYGAVSVFLTVRKVRKNLGGMSGDISGCAITIAETCALAALAVMEELL